jgi:hypothetical protein
MNNAKAPDHTLSNKKLVDALLIIDTLDTQRNLHRSTPVILFFSSFAIGLWSFFFFFDFVIWDGINNLIASMLASISWVLIFPVWIISFLLLMTALKKLGFTDIKSDAVQKIKCLAMNQDELNALSKTLRSRNNKNGDLFQAAVFDLASTN